MKALVLAHAYLIGATIHTPKENRSPTKEEVLKAIREELSQQNKSNTECVKRSRPYDISGDCGND